ncbi:MAG: hypothetical protein H7245_10235 [Candidatus Saccharibacteria bacterium]|nr:hypothetical protein [Pseudorhodobacter sp.]
MTAHWVQDGPATTRGGAAVGQLHELPPLERGAILLLRQWCDGAEARLGALFVHAFDPATTGRLTSHLDHLVTLLTRHGRRPMIRLDLHSPSFGADEAVFAHLIAAAMVGDNEDAMAFALTLLPPALAWDAVQFAAPLGHAILTLARHTDARSQPPATFH